MTVFWGASSYLSILWSWKWISRLLWVCVMELWKGNRNINYWVSVTYFIFFNLYSSISCLPLVQLLNSAVNFQFLWFYCHHGFPYPNPVKEQFSKICVKSSLYQQIGFYYPSCLITAKIPSICWRGRITLKGRNPMVPRWKASKDLKNSSASHEGTNKHALRSYIRYMLSIKSSCYQWRYLFCFLVFIISKWAH